MTSLFSIPRFYCFSLQAIAETQLSAASANAQVRANKFIAVYRYRKCLLLPLAPSFIDSTDDDVPVSTSPLSTSRKRVGVCAKESQIASLAHTANKEIQVLSPGWYSIPATTVNKEARYTDGVRKQIEAN